MLTWYNKSKYVQLALYNWYSLPLGLLRQLQEALLFLEKMSLRMEINGMWLICTGSYDAVATKPVLMPRGDITTIKFDKSIIINRPIEEVWKFISNVENLPKWNRGTRKGHVSSEGSIDIGSTVQHRCQFLGRQRNDTSLQHSPAHDEVWPVFLKVCTNWPIVTAASQTRWHSRQSSICPSCTQAIKTKFNQCALPMQLCKFSGSSAGYLGISCKSQSFHYTPQSRTF